MSSQTLETTTADGRPRTRTRRRATARARGTAANFKMALADVGEQPAFARPAPDRHNIAEIARASRLLRPHGARAAERRRRRALHPRGRRLVRAAIVTVVGRDHRRRWTREQEKLSAAVVEDRGGDTVAARRDRAVRSGARHHLPRRVSRGTGAAGQEALSGRAGVEGGQEGQVGQVGRVSRVGQIGGEVRPSAAPT